MIAVFRDWFDWVIFLDFYDGLTLMEDSFDSLGIKLQSLASTALATTVGAITRLVVEAPCCLCCCLSAACCQVWSNLETDPRE